MVIVDVVEVDGESAACLGDTLVPGRVVDGRVEIVHTGRIGFLGRLLSEDGSVKQHIGDILKLVVLDLNFVDFTENSDIDRFSRCVDRVVDATNTGNDPDEILVLKIFAHELGHDSETTDLMRISLCIYKRSTG